MGTYRTSIDANRSAVRASGAAHKCPVWGGLEGLELPFSLEPPV
ncbi:hypothetical protein [Nocardioides humilatus]|nr:hypothetical protein [Nocardioides humilatus]